MMVMCVTTSVIMVFMMTLMVVMFMSFMMIVVIMVVMVFVMIMVLMMFVRFMISQSKTPYISIFIITPIIYPVRVYENILYAHKFI